MKLKRVKLRGFIGLQRGLGVDELDLDLSGMSGLIALSGPNGFGKSTLLENFQPFRTLASREKTLAAHCFLKDSMKELDFWHEGHDYKTRVLINANNGKSEGYIWKDDIPQVDGKIPNYDQYIEKLFGSQTLFFASVFCAQNATKLSEMTTGQLKTLFSEFLRLDRYVAWESAAKQAANILTGKAREIDQAVAHAEMELGKRPMFERTLKALESSAQMQNTDIERMIVDQVETERLLKELTAKIKDNAVTVTKIEALEKERVTVTKGTQDAHTKSKAEIKTLALKLSTAETYDLPKLKELIANEEAIRQASFREKALQEQIGFKRDIVDKLQSDISVDKEMLSKMESDRKELNTKLGILRENPPGLATLKARLASYEDQSRQLDVMDPACISDICGLSALFRNARKNIPDVRAEIEARLGQIETERAILTGKKNEVDLIVADLTRRVNTWTVNLSEQRKGLQTLEKDLRAAAVLSSQLPAVEAARARIEALAKEIEDLKGRIGQIQKSDAETQDVAFAKTMELDDTITALSETIDRKAEVELKKTETKLSELKTGLEAKEKALSETSRQIIAAQTQLENLRAIEEKATQDRTRRLVLISDSSEWQYIQAACGKDGLRALEIDSVAPGVSAYANELLSQTFGTYFSIRFRTQDDAGREVLDIIVLPERGDEVLLENLSGGQKTWCLKGLRLALTLVSKEKSGRNFLSCFADEEDGGLDTENAQHFIQLYRAFMKAGEFNSMFYISHREECINMADHVLRFMENGIKIE